MKIGLFFAGLLAVATASPISELICGRTGTGSKLHPDCTKFYMCDNGFLTVQSCSPTLYYNGETCDYPQNVHDCVNGFREIPGGEEAAPEDPAPVDPEPEDPASEEPAPEEPAASASEEQTPVEPVPVDPIWNGECPIAPFYYLTNPANSNAFFICLNGVASGSGKCGEGLVFDQVKQYCH